MTDEIDEDRAPRGPGDPPPDPGPDRRVRVILGLGVAVAILAGIVVHQWPSAPPTGGAPSASALASAPPRCFEVAPGKTFVVGPEAPPRAAPSVDAPDVDPASLADRDDMLAPFAVVLGRAAAYEGGFAFGYQKEGEGGSVASLALVAPDGASGTSVRLSRSRGDMDPPVVAPGPGGSFLVALVEANAGGRAVRLASVKGGEVSWGAEIPEGRDESLAVDLAVGPDRAVVAWDDLDDARSFVAIATFAPASPGSASPPRRVTKASTDGEAPRVVAWSDGFFLAYLARGEERPRAAAGEPEASASASARPSAAATRERDEVDETRGGEPVAATWIEILALDREGAPRGEPVRVGDEGGHVVSFDVAPAPDGGLVVAYREEAAPTGAGGGPVRVARVVAGSGVAESSETPGDVPSDGAPTLVPGWLAVPTLRGPDLLARLGEAGMPSEPIEVEPSLARGEPIAASGKRLLLAEPEGRAMRLRVVECGDRPPRAAAIEPEDE